MLLEHQVNSNMVLASNSAIPFDWQTGTENEQIENTKNFLFTKVKISLKFGHLQILQTKLRWGHHRHSQSNFMAITQP